MDIYIDIYYRYILTSFRLEIKLKYFKSSIKKWFIPKWTYYLIQNPNIRVLP